MLIDIHTHSPSKSHLSIQSLPLEANASSFYFSSGIHPWLAEKIEFKNSIPKLLSVISHPQFLILGEMGLDRVCQVNFEKQIELFSQQIHFAKKHSINVLLIHCVRSLNEVLKLVSSCKYQGHLIFHDSNFNQQESLEVIKRGHFLSFGKNFFKANSKAYRGFSNDFLSNCFFETDDADFNIGQVYNRAASLLKLDSEELEEIVLKNFQHLFPKANIHL